MFSVFGPQSATAVSLVNENVEASAIMAHTSYVPPNTERCWYAFDLNGSDPDTIMHLWDWTLYEEVGWSDDYYGTSGSSACIETGRRSRRITVFIRAKSESNAGTADLVELDQGGGAPNFIFNDGEFGGTIVDVYDGDALDHITAYAPDLLTDAFSYPAIHPAANNTILFNMTNDGHMLGLNSNGSVGRMSRISGTPETAEILVASNPWSSTSIPGVTNLYSTTEDDNDGDGLGYYLERELGTCDHASQPGCGNDGYRFIDSDNDGIEDGAELLGFDTFLSSMHFPHWGANPLAKDVFVEVDYAAGDFTENPFLGLTEVQLQNWIERVAGDFFEGSAEDLHNRNNEPGLRIHIDAGIDAPASLFNAAITHHNDWYTPLHLFFGDYGGGGDAYEYTDNDIVGEEYKNAYHTMAFTRRGFFRYALATNNGGQSNGRSMSWNFENYGNPGTFLHETGHMVGLEHWGDSQFNDTILNCNPGYRSIMNYGAGRQTGFSTDNQAPITLNPSNIRERYVYSGTEEYDNAYLAENNWFFSLSHFYSGNSGAAASVDWDRDGVISNNLRRHMLNNANSECDAYFSPNPRKEEETDGVPSTITTILSENYPIEDAYSGESDLIIIGDYLYAFWIEDDKVQYRVAEHSGLENGGCTLGDEWGTECVEWSNQHILTIPNISGSAGSFSIAEWEGDLVMAYGTRNNYNNSTRWRALIFNPNESNGNLGEANITDGYLGYGNWSSLSVVNTAQEQILYLALNGTTQISSDPWSGFQWNGAARDINENIIPMSNTYAPDIVAYPSINPNNNIVMGTGCAVFPDNDNVARFYCLDPNNSNLRWREINVWETPPTIASDVSLVFRQVREPDGEIYSSNFGQFLMSAGQYYDNREENYDEITRVWQGDIFGAYSIFESEFSMDRRNLAANSWMEPINDSTIRLYTHPQLGAMKAIGVIPTHPNLNKDIVSFNPIADGSWDTDLGTGNDFRVMERGVCQGIRSQISCNYHPDCDDNNCTCDEFECENFWNY